MNEDERRERERAWRKEGGAEAEAAHLALELRAGRLAPEACELAALVGWPAARIVLGRRAPPSPRAPSSFTRWTARLRRHGPRALTRALVAVGRARLNEGRSGTWELGVTERWVVGDRETLAERCEPGLPVDGAARVARAAFQVATTGWLLQPVSALGLEAFDLEAVRAEVGAWALGRHDPVAERCARLPLPRRPDPPVLNHHRAFLRLVGGPRSIDDYDA